jgi:hypothetical protein
MSVYQECLSEGGNLKNTGAKEQCLEGLTIKTAIAIPGFSFATVADFKTKAKWDEAIADKKIFPLYDVEELASANTEDTFFEGRNRQYRTAKGKKASTYSSFLGLCSHSALKSFHGKEMQLFEFTEDGAILGTYDADGIKVKGQDVVLNIGKRVSATADRPPSTQVTINYKDQNQLEDNGVIARPSGWDGTDIFGIFDVVITQVSASATEIKFTVKEGCAGGGELVTTLIAADVVVKDDAGGTETVSFVVADADGIYTVTGTGFADDYTVNLNGVVTSGGSNYEAPEPLTISVT